MAHWFLSILFIFTFFGQALQAQEKQAWSFGANPYYGSVMRYKKEQPKLNFPGFYGLELYAQKITNGKRRWERMYDYPHLGLALEYYNFGVPDELGEVVMATTYLDFTFNHHSRSQLRVNLGTGLVYSSKTYDLKDNPDNFAVSTPISYVLRATLHYEMPLSQKVFVNLNASYRHYSNGRWDMPNNGMNFPLVGIGIRYLPQAPKIDYLKDTSKTYDKLVHFNLMASTSWRQVWREDYPHRAYTVSSYFSKQVSKYNAILLGVDYFKYDEESVVRAIHVVPNPPEGYSTDGTQVAITVGGELYLGRLWVIIQGGFYVYEPADISRNWYQRYGLKYLVTKDIFVNVNLKTHSRTADMIEFGLGVKI